MLRDTPPMTHRADTCNRAGHDRPGRNRAECIDRARPNAGRLAAAGLVCALALLATHGPAQAQGQPCDVTRDKTALPSAVTLGAEVTIRLSLAATCPATETPEPADIVVAIDRSNSMSEQGRWAATISAAQEFAALVDYSVMQVGVVTFSDGGIFEPEATIHLPLSGDGAAVGATLAGLAPPPETTLWTNLTAAIQTSRTALDGAGARTGVRQVIVMLTDGEHNALLARSPRAEASDARAAGVTLITIGLSVNTTAADLLRDIAGDPALYFEAPTPADVAEAYRRAAQALAGVGVVTNVRITDELSADVELVPGSIVPGPTRIEGRRLIWELATLPTSGWSAQYRVRPLRAGTYPTNVTAFADYTGPTGPGQVVFPVPQITVTVPANFKAYLPRLMRNHCRPAAPFDVVLAIDASTSMAGEKAERARAAAAAFIDLLQRRPSQVGVLQFNEDAAWLQHLTTDRALALGALDRLTTGTGTRIDRALDAARIELTGPGAGPGHVQAVVLLTDGRQSGAPDQVVRDEAAGARAAGLTLYTVGIGDDVSRELLVDVAGSPARYYPAAGPGELYDIFISIAGVLPCTGG